MRTSSIAQRLRFVGVTVALLASIGFAVFHRPSHPEVEMSISRIVDVHTMTSREDMNTMDFRLPTLVVTNGYWVVVLEVRNASSRLVWFGEEKVQTKAHGRWLEAQQVSWLNCEWFVANVNEHSEREFVAAVIPKELEAARLFLKCHHRTLIQDVRNYCNLLRAKYPRQVNRVFSVLDRWLLFPLDRWSYTWGWRHFTVEFTLPLQPQQRGPVFKLPRNEQTTRCTGAHAELPLSRMR
jgi:hypothetical protein